MKLPERTETTAASLAGPAGEGGLLLERGGLVVYIDPSGACAGLPKADIVCLSAVDPRRLEQGEQGHQLAAGPAAEPLD